MKTIIDVSVSPKTSYKARRSIPERIEALNNEKKSICEKISDFKKSIQLKRRKDLILSSTGYFKPTITYGLSELKTVTDGFYVKVYNEIEYVLAFNDLEASTSKQYVDQLVEMREQVHSQYKNIPDLLRRKIGQ